MITIYIYNTKSLQLIQELTAHELTITTNLKPGTDFTLTPPPDYDLVWQWVDTKWLELLPINNPDIFYDDKSTWDAELNQWVKSPELEAYKHIEEQQQAWENIKKLRYEKMTGGVYIPSLNKWVHTDEAASTQYAFIGLRIMQGTYTPIVWKAMDNTFIQLTEEVFIELQERMMEQTQTIHAKAEYHKLMMEASENPLEYDYTTNWE